jgi:D-alanyl-lipoteichoic acid acyltransferase DltB (MBOAT superfamily)
MRDIFTLNEIWAQDKNIYFGRHFAWLKYFTYQLVPVLAPNYEPPKDSFLSVSQHAD